MGRVLCSTFLKLRSSEKSIFFITIAKDEQMLMKMLESGNLPNACGLVIELLGGALDIVGFNMISIIRILSC